MRIIVLAALLAIGCTPEWDQREGEGTTTSDLSTRTDTLWPVANGIVPIHVCWGESLSEPSRWPLPQLAPRRWELHLRKAWVRMAAQDQWNARTPIRFFGWESCDGSDPNAIEIVPIDSMSKPACSDNHPGQPCVEELGRKNRGHKLFLNLYFGDEFLYASTYAASFPNRDAVDPTFALPANAEGALYWVPGACLDDLSKAWAPWSTKGPPIQKQDVRDPRVRMQALQIIRTCLQANALHELGHVAGFTHEQYRTDDVGAQKACLEHDAQQGSEPADIMVLLPQKALPNIALGPFDSESIMSYCRQDKRPLLTDEDVQMARLVYGFRR